MFEYEGKIQHWVNRLSFLLRSEIQRRFKDNGIDLSAEEWALLMVLWQKGPLQMGPLAAITLRDRTTVTRLVDRLVEKKYLQRANAEGDRRQVVVSVSKAGREIEERVVGIVLPLIKKSGEGISENDGETALAVLRKMTENLDDSRN